MPIVSRVLTKLANRADIGPGIKRWRVDGLDGRGQPWVHGPFFGTQAEGEIVRDAVFTTAQLEDEDERHGIIWCEQGNDPNAFPREDLTLADWRGRVARRWWKTRIEGSSPNDLAYLCHVASFIDDFTAAQIAGVLGISETKAQKGLDRAIDLVANTCPAIFASDAQQEDV